jgi:hypothetical protein
MRFGCAPFSGGAVDFDPTDPIFEVPAHDPKDAGQTSRYYLIKCGSRVTVARGYPPLPTAEQTVIVEVRVYRYNTDGDGRYNLWREEFDYSEETIVHPDGRRLINPPYREAKLYVGVRKEAKSNRFVFRRVLIDRHDLGRRLGADGIFEEQHVQPAGKLSSDDIETAL